MTMNNYEDMMGKDPAFLFYYRDFLVSTELMSHEDVGKYIRILCHLADKENLTPTQVQSLCNASVIPESIQEKLKSDGNGKLYNKRLTEVMTQRRIFTESRRRNASKRYSASAELMGNANENEIEDVSEVKNEEKKPKKHKHGEHKNVLLTNDQFQNLLMKYKKEITTKAINILSEYLVTYKGGDKYKSHYHVLIKWPMKEASQNSKSKMQTLVDETVEKYGGQK